MKPKTIAIDCVGYSIVADWYEGESSENVLLSLVGWTSSRTRYTEIITGIVEATGMSALVIDYTGHGDSPFDALDMRPAQHFLEVVTAYDWIRSKYPGAGISVMGTSYGGFMAATLTEFRDIKNLILRVPAVYKPKDFYTPNREIHESEEAKLKYRNDRKKLEANPLYAKLRQFTGNSLVVVHEHDELVPKPTTDAYIAALQAESSLAEGFAHSFTKSQVSEEQLKRYQQAITTWLLGRL